MKAMVFETFGPPEVLHLKELDKPVPGKGEVLIKVHATTVTKYDCWVRSNTAPPGFGLLVRLSSGRTPKQPVLGTELAGEIAAVGEGVTRFKAGDPVLGYSAMNLGACAEYISLPEAVVVDKPANTTDEEAAGVLQGALTALYFLRKAHIQRGDKILIFGASGGVGSYAVQLASRYFDAQVTGVCSTAKMDYVKQLGADRVIDYTREDFTRNGEVYDVIFDTVGKSSIARSRRSLQKDGVYLLATLSLPMMVQVFWYSLISRQKFEFGALKEQTADLILLKDLIEKDVIKPVVDRCYPLEEAAEAHRYVEAGYKEGSVVLTIYPAASMNI